ncbi:zinc finger protein 346 [Cucumis melo var. makuwa]|uniref:Zinc finger protein 346 n=1 Tax=Cucumis melo var. makuwa TaxID=1194695 RepID=A0A5A7UWU3_CUCMM|nr:zinc finger protein 346 [Cucumis melo var. makuwa]
MFYHHQQQQPPPPSSSSSVPLYLPPHPHIVNAHPSFPPFPQPVLPPGVASEPGLHPPGTDPYSNSAVLTSSYVGLEPQPQFYADPSLASHNWILPQPDAAGFAFKSLLESQIASTSSNSLLNGNWPVQSLANSGSRTKHVKTKFTQPVRCEICKIDCNSKDVFDKHVMGKKHKKNLGVPNSSRMGSTPSDGNTNVLNQMGNVSGQVAQVTADVPAARKGLMSKKMSKKRKLIDTSMKADPVRVCTVCNIVCNSQEVFDKHLSGKKHAAQAALTSHVPYVAAIGPQYDGSLKKKLKKNKVVQSAWCEVCKISCNSNEIYAMHLSGKKHLKNVEKVEKGKSDVSTSNAPQLATVPVIGPMENPVANNPSSDDIQKTQKSSTQTPEGLETKKRKIVKSGRAANSVRTCTICNVVCNSQTVFDSHLAGQKHASMMKKQGVSGMSIVVPPLITALPN